MSSKETVALNRMQWILTDEELMRFNFIGDTDNLVIQLDLHGLTCRETRRLVCNLIALIQNEFELLIIHGYRHGCALSDMLRYEFASERLTNRLGDDTNPGVTLFRVA